MLSVKRPQRKSVLLSNFKVQTQIQLNISSTGGNRVEIVRDCAICRFPQHRKNSFISQDNGSRTGRNAAKEIDALVVWSGSPIEGNIVRKTCFRTFVFCTESSAKSTIGTRDVGGLGKNVRNAYSNQLFCGRRSGRFFFRAEGIKRSRGTGCKGRDGQGEKHEQGKNQRQSFFIIKPPCLSSCSVNSRDKTVSASVAQDACQPIGNASDRIRCIQHSKKESESQ